MPAILTTINNLPLDRQPTPASMRQAHIDWLIDRGIDPEHPVFVKVVETLGDMEGTLTRYAASKGLRYEQALDDLRGLRSPKVGLLKPASAAEQTALDKAAVIQARLDEQEADRQAAIVAWNASVDRLAVLRMTAANVRTVADNAKEYSERSAEVVSMIVDSLGAIVEPRWGMKLAGFIETRAQVPFLLAAAELAEKRLQDHLEWMRAHALLWSVPASAVPLEIAEPFDAAA